MLVGHPADRGAGGQELGRVLAPDVVLQLDRDADDARRLGLRGLGLHPHERQLACLVDALGDWIISWFCPVWRSDCIIDWCAMW